MGLHDRTKWLLADTLMKLARSKPIKNIQVKEICQSCGADRTTFYYHFRDKYDLVAWIFSRMYVDEAGRAEYLNDEKMMVRMFNRLWENRPFFMNALQDHSQNNLGQYILDFYIDAERAVLCDALGVDTLDEETEYAIKQYSFGCLMHTVEWLLGKNKLTPEKMAHYQFECMPAILKSAWQKKND